MRLADFLNKNEGVSAALGIFVTIIISFFSKLVAGVILFVLLGVAIIYYLNKTRKRALSFSEARALAKILFIDDKGCQIVVSLRRNGFEVRKIDDVTAPSTDKNVQWANIVFIDYKDVGKSLYKQKEGLGLIADLRNIFGSSKRYVIYSSVQDFEGLVGFPYIRKNASYDEFIARIVTEMNSL